MTQRTFDPKMREKRGRRRRRRRCHRSGHVPELPGGWWCSRCGCMLPGLVAREPFPAPRADDCRYGCCKAGDVGLCSELVRSVR